MDFLKNFFECYFHQNESFDGLNWIIQHLKKPEEEIYRLQLINELYQIIQSSNYVLAAKIIKKYGGRTLDLEKTEKLIKFLYDRFTDRPTDAKPEDFKRKVKVIFCPVCCPEPNLTSSMIQKATIITNEEQIYICKPCKLVWLTEDIRQIMLKIIRSLCSLLD